MTFAASMLEWPERAIRASLRRLLAVWVRVQVFPEAPSALNDERGAPVCYVLARPSLIDAALLDLLTERRAMPSPFAALAGLDERRAIFALHDDRTRLPAKRLQRLVEAVHEGRIMDVRLIPISIFWGRAPEREERDDSPLRGMRLLRLWAAEGWGARSRLRKLLSILFYRSAVVAKFSEPLSLAEWVNVGRLEGLDRDRLVRRAARLLRAEFRSVREAAIGPDLSHRRTLIDAMLRDPRVRAAIDAEARARKVDAAKVERRAASIGREIAADYSFLAVRIGARILGRLWTRIYQGVEVRGIERVQALAKDNTLVYVPCHRSHIDYLLLSYVVHGAGLVVPHIAAGANLNLPIIGGLLRRGGAFFLRRSFKGDELYGEVFAAYLHEVLKRGFSIEYFVEGGRSRTGRMLPPKAGLVSMTVQSFLREHTRPLLFIPVYIGYERLIEGGSYTQELSGAAKRKESLWGLLGAVRELRGQHYGSVGVSFARPIALGELLDAEGAHDMPTWLADKGLRRSTLTELSRRIAERINGAAQVNPVALIATLLLATPKHAADATLLADMVASVRRLLSVVLRDPEASITPLDGEAAIAYTARLGYLRRQQHPLGDVVSAGDDAAVALTYFRNNVLHGFALPGLLACLVVQHGVIGETKLARLSRAWYVLFEAELFLPPWRDADTMDDESDDGSPRGRGKASGDGRFPLFGHVLAAMEREGWLQVEREARVISAPTLGSDAAMRLELLAATMRPTLLRHALMLALAGRMPTGEQTRERIETLCQQSSQHLAMTHVFNAPEFSDRTQFRSAFEALVQANLLRVDEGGVVHYGDALNAQAEEAIFLLPPDSRAAVLRAVQRPAASA